MPYNAGDLKWGDTTLGTPSGTITWSVDYGDALNFAPGYSQADFDAALISAFDAWENVASIDFQMVPFGDPADVVVGAASLGGAAGIAEYTFDGNPGLSEIFSGTVTFNSDLTWTPYGQPGGVDFFAVALHEIGHIIGLGHVNDTSEIMNPVIYADDLGSGDIAGAQFLYGRDPGDVPTLADFGLYGPMFRHFSQDPTPAEVMRLRAPAVFEWVARLWNARGSRLGGGLVNGIPDDLLPLLTSLVAVIVTNNN